MTTLLKKDYQYSSVLWEEVMQRVQEIIRDEYNISPYVSPTLNPKTPSPFRIWSSAQGTDALYVGAWHKEYTISVNHYLKAEDSERFYRKVYEESERLYQLFFNNQGTQSTQTLGFFGGRPEGIQISQEGDYFRIEVLFTCEVLRADDVVYVQTLPSEIRATRRALELPFNFWSLDFDGTDDLINCGSDSSLDDIFDGGGSVSVWFNASAINATHTIVSKKSGGTGWWAIRISDHSGNTGRFYFAKSFDGSHYTTQQSARDINPNKWYHAVVVYNADSASNRITAYLNGEVVTNMSTSMDSTSAPTGTRISDANQDFLIGKDDQFEFLGQMSEVSVFNSALSSSEISTIYNDGQPILLTENQGGYKSSSNLVSYYRMGSGSGDDRSTNGLIADQVDSSLTSISLSDTSVLENITGTATQSISSNLESGNSYKLSYTKTNSNTSGYSKWRFGGGSYTTIQTTSSLSGDIVFYFVATESQPLQWQSGGTPNWQGSITNISLQKSNGNAGVMSSFDSLDFRTNVPLLYDKALFSNSLVFDGTDDYIELAGFFRIGDYPTGTVSLWFKATDADVGSTDQHIFSARDERLTDSRFYIALADNGKIEITMGDGDSDAVIDDISYSADTWTHVAVTWKDNDGSGGTAIAYINGVAHGTTITSIDSANGNGGKELSLGGYAITSTNNSYDGNIDGVAIYNSTLDATNVTAIYNSGKPIDLTCDAGNYNNANNLVGYWKMGDGYLDKLPSADINGAIVDQVTPIIGNDVLSHNIDDWTLGNNSGATSTKAYSDGVYTITRESEGTGTAYTYIIQSGIENNTLYKVNFSYKTTVNLEVLGTYNTGSVIALSPTTEYIEKTVFIVTNSTYAGKFQIRAVGNFQLKNLTYKKVNGNSGLCVNMNASAQSISVPE
tara:strand:- start:330 stop:3035 length:2706 start_codon:yes stop_codon:yes gene_type:complete